MRTLLLSLGVAALAAMPVSADRFTAGGDVYLAGPDARAAPAVERDLFAVGFSTRLASPVAGDAHLSGFSVDVEAPVSADLYAAGSNVTVEAAVGEDLTAAAFSLETREAARVAGNARLAGGSVTVGGPVRGTLIVSGGEVTLDAPVEGDAWVAAGSLRFGDDARIGGTLRYAAPERVDIPPEVIPADRVTYTVLDRAAPADDESEWGDDWPVPGPYAVVGATLTTLAFLMIVGAVLLAFLPHRVETLRARAVARPGLMLLAGIAGLSMLFGLVPVSAMTIVGLPLIPLVLLAIVAGWTAGYLLGVYALAMRVVDAFHETPGERGLGERLLALLGGLAVAILLNFVPFLGWILNFGIVLLGIGAITAALFAAMAGRSTARSPGHPV